MKMSGEQVIPAPRQRVWEALNDPEVLRQSIPGCNEMVKHSATEFTAKVLAKVGPVKANFTGDVTLSKLNPPESYLISGQGTGGVAGFASGGAEVRLEEVDGQTRLIYDVDAKVGGKLAQIGSRLIDSTARKMADDFFKRFSEVVTSGHVPAAAEEEVVQVPAADEVAKAPAKKAAAKKAPAKKAPAKKAAAKKSPAKKAAPKKTGKGNGSTAPDRSAQPREVAPSGESAAPAPSLMPEAAVASSASTEDRQGQAQQQSFAGSNLWWLVGAAVVALLIILVLANV